MKKETEEELNGRTSVQLVFESQEDPVGPEGSSGGLQDRDSHPLEQGAGLLTLQRIRKNTSVPLPSLQGRDQQAHYPGLKVCAAEAPGCPLVRLPPPAPASPPERPPAGTRTCELVRTLMVWPLRLLGVSRSSAADPGVSGRLPAPKRWCGLTSQLASRAKTSDLSQVPTSP